MSLTRKRNAENNKDADVINKKLSILKHLVFMFKKELLQSDDGLKMYRLHHPGREKGAYFILHKDQKKVYEVLEFNESHRSWLINENINSNGKLYITVQIDAIFLALYYLKKCCSQKFIQLEQLEDPDYPIVSTFLEDFVDKDLLTAVADTKSAMELMVYKYNSDKTLAWLSIKAKRLAARLKKEQIYCGISSLSANYAKSEKTEALTEDTEYLRTACGIIGDYVDRNQYHALLNYLNIQDDVTTKQPNNINKRKSTKHELSITSPDENENVTKKIKLENDLFSPKASGNGFDSRLKEKKISAKEKSLIKAASGTKSISSFFKK